MPGDAVVDLPLDEGQVRARVNARPHEETPEETLRWQTEELGGRFGGRPRSELALQAHGRFVRLGERIVG